MPKLKPIIYQCGGCKQLFRTKEIHLECPTCKSTSEFSIVETKIPKRRRIDMLDPELTFEQALMIDVALCPHALIIDC